MRKCASLMKYRRREKAANNLRKGNDPRNDSQGNFVLVRVIYWIVVSACGNKSMMFKFDGVDQNFLCNLESCLL